MWRKGENASTISGDVVEMDSHNTTETELSISHRVIDRQDCQSLQVPNLSGFSFLILEFQPSFAYLTRCL
jgi:hypothetical protein